MPCFCFGHILLLLLPSVRLCHNYLLHGRRNSFFSHTHLTLRAFHVKLKFYFASTARSNAPWDKQTMQYANWRNTGEVAWRGPDFGTIELICRCSHKIVSNYVYCKSLFIFSVGESIACNEFSPMEKVKVSNQSRPGRLCAVWKHQLGLRYRCPHINWFRLTIQICKPIKTCLCPPCATRYTHGPRHACKIQFKFYPTFYAYDYRNDASLAVFSTESDEWSSRTARHVHQHSYVPLSIVLIWLRCTIHIPFATLNVITWIFHGGIREANVHAPRPFSIHPTESGIAAVCSDELFQRWRKNCVSVSFY